MGLLAALLRADVRVAACCPHLYFPPWNVIVPIAFVYASLFANCLPCKWVAIYKAVWRIRPTDRPTDRETDGEREGKMKTTALLHTKVEFEVSDDYVSKASRILRSGNDIPAFRKLFEIPFHDDQQQLQ